MDSPSLGNENLSPPPNLPHHEGGGAKAEEEAAGVCSLSPAVGEGGSPAGSGVRGADTVLFQEASTALIQTSSTHPTQNVFGRSPKTSSNSPQASCQPRTSSTRPTRMFSNPAGSKTPRNSLERVPRYRHLSHLSRTQYRYETFSGCYSQSIGTRC